MAENPKELIEEDEVEESQVPAWMITYGDMVTLLLVFFVLLFSFAIVDAKKFEHMIQSMQGALGVISGNKGELQTGEIVQDKLLIGGKDLDELNDFFKEFKDYVKDNKLENIADVTYTEQGIVISLTNMLIFPSGSSRLSRSGRQSLEKIRSLVERYPYEINVIGHTDPHKIKSKKYPSNWELSLDRAAQVMEFYKRKNPEIEKRFSLTAFGSNRPLVIGNQEIKPDMSRRVDLVFQKPELGKKPSF